MGSATEVCYLSLVASDLGLLPDEASERLQDEALAIHAMLLGFQRRISGKR